MASQVTDAGASSISENTGVVLSPVWKEHDVEHGFADPLLELIAARFQLLSEPVRLKILAVLATGERSVGELVTFTGTGQPNVSKHLAALAQGGLIKRRKVGTSIYYAVADPVVFTLCDVVCASVQQRITEEAQALGFETVPAHPQKGNNPSKSEHL
jgi:DNA-binding transcriptional ArsR family regulator